MRISDRSSDVCSSDLATRCITGAEQLLCNRHRINTGDARRRRLRGKVRGEIGDVFVRQSRSLRLHQRILALAGLEAMQLLADVVRALSGQLRPFRIGAVAAGAVTGRAGSGLGGTPLDAAVRERMLGDRKSGG